MNRCFRFLIGSLRREKDRLMKRELSVECKLGEVEDYKTHVKQDMVSALPLKLTNPYSHLGKISHR